MQPDRGPAADLVKPQKDEPYAAIPQLVQLAYDELRRVAAARLQAERDGHTLTPTALVHETYLRLVRSVGLQFTDRQHFLLVAAQAMRRILVDHARARCTARRGGGSECSPLDGIALAAGHPDEEVLALDAALTKLADLSPRQRKVVELRYFAGLTDDEIAHVLGVNRRTINRDWKMAKAWLHSRLRPESRAGMQ